MFDFRESGMKKEIIILGICIILLVSINYNSIDSRLEGYFTESDFQVVEIKRVIDGDTVVYNNKSGSEVSVRLLGINTPEKGERYFSEAKEFMESKILNKSVKLVYGDEKTDRYGRELAYIFYKGKNINLEIVGKGYGNYYFPSGRTRYYGSFVKEWEECLENELRLCEKSENKCAECIELKEIDEFEQEVLFYNSCSFSCNLTDWNIKDEGRKKFVFQDFVLESGNKVAVRVGDNSNTKNRIYWKGEDYVWTSSGDSLFLRDNEGKLVLWKVIS